LESPWIGDEKDPDQEQRNSYFAHEPSISPRLSSIIPGVKILLLLMVISLVALIPFVVLRKPWAVRLWSRMKTIIVVYAIIIATAGIVRLILNWDDIY